MNKRIERQVQRIYESVFKKVFTARNLRKFSKMSKSEVKNAILNTSNSKAYNKFAEKFARELAKRGLSQQRGVWRKFFEAAKRSKQGVVQQTYTEFQNAQIVKAVQHNFKMIKSIPKYVLDVYEQKYITTLRKQVQDGVVGRRTFENQLKKHGATHARLVARTETAKLQTAIMQSRSTDLGSVAYMWLSSNDSRTRQSHKQMNGVVVFWQTRHDNKPMLDKMRGNAGEFPNCRCSTEPIFDERDLKQSRFRVYNHKTNKIITMTKAELTSAIKKGGL